MSILRHLLSILLLPFLVVVVLPWWLLSAFATGDSHWADGSMPVLLFRVIAVLLGLTGFGLFAWCVSLFARIGQGTLAPWDPTRKLVAVGPYRHVRNPMISGVALMLSTQALFHGSWIVAAWAGLFMLINHTYFLLSEEPGLEKRFGDSYRNYKANVPRWLPRLRPWSGE